MRSISGHSVRIISSSHSGGGVAMIAIGALFIVVVASVATRIDCAATTKGNTNLNQACNNAGADALEKLGEMVLHLGEIKTSKTFPSLCRVTMDTAIANLETIARLQTINYDGEVQTNGGDPVTALGKY